LTQVRQAMPPQAPVINATFVISSLIS